MFDSLGAVLAGLGGLLVGLAAVISLIVAQRARAEAAEARRVSPAAVFEGLRVQVQAVVDAHVDAVRRHQIERDYLQDSLDKERARADGAEVVGLQRQARLAEASIDIAALRAEVQELRTRFEASITA